MGHFKPVVYLIASLFAMQKIHAVDFDLMMSENARVRTGICRLTYVERAALSEWIDDHFSRKDPDEGELYLTMNVNNGAQLELSDGSAYEIDPKDRIYTAYWLTPFAVGIGRSNDPNYPLTITNLQSETTVQAKQIPAEELLTEDKDEKLPPPEKKKEEKTTPSEKAPKKQPKITLPPPSKK